MKKNGDKILYVSFVLLVIVSIYSNFMADNSFISVILYLLIVLIPTIYSIIPLIKEQKIKKNSRKNRLTDYTFTDRHEDLYELIEKISIQEHILEIKGNEHQCGKTWLAKKLCDYINYPDDKRKPSIERKCIYNSSYYIDMRNCSENELNNFFQNKYINSKVVLIFDHVINLSELLSKQKLYHFQMVYVLENAETHSFQSHIISEFKTSDIVDLQRKIKKNYPDISSLTEKEIDVLYKLTNGNIGKIHTLLCEQRFIDWIKAIAENRMTDYDIELNKVQATLFIGKYTDARDELNTFESNYNTIFDKNNDLKYKYTLMLSDCEHLLTNYKKALNILAIIDNHDFQANNKKYQIELHKAHYLKHLWKCNDALEILWSIKDKEYSAAADSLGILLAKYFIDDLYIPQSDDNSLEAFMNMFIFAQTSTLPHDINNELKVKRSEAIYLYYKKHPKTLSELLNIIDSVIINYKAQNNRLLANAYFIRGEIYRLYHDYENTLSDYSRSLSVTHDNNIIIQVQLMLYYLYKCKKINNQTYPLLDIKDIMDLCAKNNYANKVFQRIRHIENNDTNSKYITDCFENRVMPIL
mgnify:CR=1 FL=1